MSPRGLFPLAAGGLFGTGLLLSGMVDPQKVQDFLDVTDPARWDPSLLLVMGGALLVAFFAFPPILRRQRPLLADSFHLPRATAVDPELLLGGVFFGVGWGLGGFCPGPALVALGTGSRSALLFALAMALGMALHRAYTALRGPRYSA